MFNDATFNEVSCVFVCIMVLRYSLCEEFLELFVAFLLGDPGRRAALFVGETECLSSPGLLEKKDRYLAQPAFRSKVQKCVLWSRFCKRKWS